MTLAERIGRWIAVAGILLSLFTITFYAGGIAKDVQLLPFPKVQWRLSGNRDVRAFNLLIGSKGGFIRAPLEVADPGQNASKDRNYAGENERPPIKRRIVVVLFGWGGWAWLIGWGGSRLKRWYGRWGVCLGFGLLYVTLLLLFLTPFRWSWSWWL